MPKLRKQRRKQVYRRNINRKRLNRRINSVGSIKCEQVKKSWEEHKSTRRNLEEMGLVYDPNQNIKIPNSKQDRKKEILAILSGTVEIEEVVPENNVPSKIHVVEELEAEAYAPRERMFRLPKGQVQWITYLLDKYGSDYKAMERDRKNYYQETWRQLRRKINTFKGIPEQYEKYLSEK